MNRTINKQILWLFLILSMVGCGPKEQVLDRAESNEYVLEIISTGMTYGEKLVIKKGDETYTIEMAEMNPWRVEFCNVDGGEPEVALGVYKESPFHEVMARRIFFYNLDGTALVPKYRMSRLSYPFVDFTMYDLDEDGRDEILAVEWMKDGGQRVGAYEWTNFGFERVYESDPLPEDAHASEEEHYAFYDEKGNFKFRLKDGGIEWE